MQAIHFSTIRKKIIPIQKKSSLLHNVFLDYYRQSKPKNSSLFGKNSKQEKALKQCLQNRWIAWSHCYKTIPMKVVPGKSFKFLLKKYMKKKGVSQKAHIEFGNMPSICLQKAL